MAMELESKIMAEIGLGMHYNWYNGSGSCDYIRREAAEKLAKAIEKHHKAGDRIAPPDKELVELVKEATGYEEDSSILTKTWVVASYVIAAHIHQAKGTKEERAKEYAHVKQYIEENVLPQKPQKQVRNSSINLSETE